MSLKAIFIYILIIGLIIILIILVDQLIKGCKPNSDLNNYCFFLSFLLIFIFNILLRSNGDLITFLIILIGYLWWYGLISYFHFYLYDRVINGVIFHYCMWVINILFYLINLLPYTIQSIISIILIFWFIVFIYILLLFFNDYFTKDIYKHDFNKNPTYTFKFVSYDVMLFCIYSIVVISLFLYVFLNFIFFINDGGYIFNNMVEYIYFILTTCFEVCNNFITGCIDCCSSIFCCFGGNGPNSSPDLEAGIPMVPIITQSVIEASPPSPPFAEHIPPSDNYISPYISSSECSGLTSAHPDINTSLIPGSSEGLFYQSTIVSNVSDPVNPSSFIQSNPRIIVIESDSSSSLSTDTSDGEQNGSKEVNIFGDVYGGGL